MLVAIAVIWTLATIFKPDAKRVRTLLMMGFFLAVFDWVFETAGLFAGYWHSSGSIFPVGPSMFYPPLEVFVIALCAGAAMDLLFPKKFDWRTALPFTMLVACVGTFIEAMLISSGNLIYLAGWTSLHAFIAYWITFLVFHWVDVELFNAPAQQRLAKRRR